MANNNNSKNLPSSRLLRYFNALYVSEDAQNQTEIIQKIVQWGFADYVDRVQALAQGLLVPLLQSLHSAVVQSFRPLPRKSHYVFNLRDLMAVLQGLLRVPEQKYSALDDVRFKLLRLWLHESRRVYADRLVDDQDRTVFDRIISDDILPLQKTFDTEQKLLQEQQQK